METPCLRLFGGRENVEVDNEQQDRVANLLLVKVVSSNPTVGVLMLHLNSWRWC